jgi:hypothetical protein
MVSSEVIDLALKKIQLEIDDQNRSLPMQIRAIQAEAAKHGALRSGGYVMSIQKLCAEAVENRAAFAWEILYRCVTTVGLSYEDGIAKQLKDVIDKNLPAHSADLQEHVTKAAELAGSPNLLSKIEDVVEIARRSAVEHAYTEIDLFVLKLKKAPAEREYAPQISIHNSTIGSLQTGSHSVTHAVQNITTGDRDALNKALDLISRELAAVPALPRDRREDVIEVIADGKAELAKATPNLSKLTGILSAVSNAIGIVEKLKPACEGLKSAAALIGVSIQ